MKRRRASAAKGERRNYHKISTSDVDCGLISVTYLLDNCYLVARNRNLTYADASMSEYCIDDVVTYLDEYLRVAAIPDDGRALNGLQVANSGRLARLATAVDVCQATIDAPLVRGG